MTRRYTSLVLMTLTLVTAQFYTNRAVAAPDRAGAIVGVVLNSQTKTGIGWASVTIEETNHGVSSHANGEFHLYLIPAGRYTVRTSHLGYRDEIKTVELNSGDTLRLTFLLSPTVISLPDVRVTGVKADANSSVSLDPVVELRGGALQREQGLTIAETIDEEPGISQRSMGPAPARPVLRGLSGDRLMIVEDGKRTGDLSATSSDHAVAVEPMTATGIQVIRGAETLLYGPGAIGGVVNIERSIIPRGVVHRVQGSASLQAESFNRGLSGGLGLTTPVKMLALKIDGSRRSAGDVATPTGYSKNTDIHTYNAGLGISLPKTWGIIGVSGEVYDTEYGIPGGFVGAHPNGVSIEMNRKNFELLTRFYAPIPVIRQIELSYSFARYYHAEWESNGSLGMEFGVLMDNLDIKTHLGKHWIFDEGVTGIWGELRDYATGGLSFTPETSESQLGLYLYEQKTVKGIHLKGAVRYDFRDVRPDREFYSIVIGNVRERKFSGVSCALSTEAPLCEGLVAGFSLIRSWRAPTVEELFSRGPHLAAYSYEIGNPDLNAEKGFGTELYFDCRKSSLHGRVSVFRNSFQDYIFPSFSGKLSATRNDLYEYYYKGRDAVMIGFETSLDFDYASDWNAHGVLSWVRGDLTEANVPMAQTPPINGRIGVLRRLGCWSVNFDAVGSMKQDRLYISEDPDARPEDPTAAWIRFDLSIQVQRPWKEMLHTAVLAVDNITNVEYRNHLSRVKSIMPEAGRNVKCIYKIYF